MTNEPDESTHVLLSWQSGDVILGLYEVIEVLGAGGMGTVYRVWHREWHTELAVKVPRPEVFSRPGGRDDFIHECETWIDLGLNPHTADCYFIRSFGGVPLIFGEYVAGGSLFDWIRSGQLYAGGKDIALERILDVAIQMAWGLAHAHAQGVVHRDVKPANVLLSLEGVAKITDFGLARARSKAGETDGDSLRTSFAGKFGYTPAYCSPEQAAFRRVSRKTDVWSWGLSVLEMFAGGLFWNHGEVANDALGWAVENGNALPQNVPRFPARVVALLQRCFAKEVESRPHDMSQIAAYLQRVYQLEIGVPYGRVPFDRGAEKNVNLRLANINNRSVSLIELGKYSEAQCLLNEARALPSNCPDDYEARLLLDVAYNRLRLDLIMESTGELKRDALPIVLPDVGDHEYRYYLSGLLHLQSGKLYSAIELLRRPSSRVSDFRADALNARGIGLLLTGELRPAIRCFKGATKAAPDRLDIHRNLALAYYYEGKIVPALDIFFMLTTETVFDAEDRIRYAAVLSAAGLEESAREQIELAVASRDRSTTVLLSGAELMLGVQTFLPGALPILDPSFEYSGLIREANEREPKNLRACIDLDTMPRRHGYRGGARFQMRRRVLPEGSTPARTGGAIAASYRAMGRACRWGDTPSLLRRSLLLFVSGIPSVTAIAIIGLALNESIDQDLGVFGDFFQRPHHAIMENGPFLVSRWTVFLSLALGPGLCFAFRTTPSKNLWRDGAIATAALFILVGFRFPSKLFGIDNYVDVYTRVVTGGAENDHFSGPDSGVLFLFCTIGVGAATVWQFLFQHLTCGDRAGWSARGVSPMHYRHRLRPDRAMRELRTMGTAKRLLLYTVAFHPRHLVRTMGVAVRTLLRERLSMAGSWMVILVLLSYISYTRDVAGIKWVPVLHATLMDTVIPDEYLLREKNQALWLAISPLVVCLISPRLGLSLYGLLVFIRLTGGTLAFITSPALTVMPPFAEGSQMVLLALAIWRCPDFIPEWRDCDASPWDIRQLVDPLNIRRYAAPWKIIPSDGIDTTRGE